MILPDALTPLCGEFDRDRPNVLVVVGAGISFGATGEPCASWRGLLEHGVRYLRDKGNWDHETATANLTLIRNAFAAEFDLDEVLGRAESVTKTLGAPDGDDYRIWLEQAIGSLEAQNERMQTLEAIAELHSAGALILTTNYDDLLCDCLGLTPVTWQEHREFLRVINRERQGILHIHGHWRHPSSVILSRSSYREVYAAKELQHVFRSLWLQWSWVYVGCGNGLDDPNVGALLQWGHDAFGDTARKHFFLGTASVASSLAARSDKPANIIPVSYGDHSKLPDVLQSLTPQHWPYPFVALGPTGGPVRDPETSPLDIPLPTWQELLDGQVPALAAETSVADALRAHGWAMVLDVASVGKTTLALRLERFLNRRNRFGIHNWWLL